MDCPKCHSTMEEITYGRNMTIDRCTNCKGIWFDLGEAETLKDKWTVVSKDRSLAAHFEHTVAVNEEKAEVLTTHKFIEENYTYKWRNKSR